MGNERALLAIYNITVYKGVKCMVLVKLIKSF
nr:MAG TPA: hypothetical protein [Inoviridae sp.]